MANGEFGGGDGTEAYPYLVEDAKDLNAVRDGLSLHYLQTDDIDLASWGNWIPIGGSGAQSASGTSSMFNGRYDGGGYQVKNMTCEHPSRNYVGLFGNASRDCLFNVGVTSQVTSGFNNVGGVSGKSIGANNCHSSGEITGSNYVGGIIGENTGSINNCYSTGDVTGSVRVGGINGGGIYGIANNCYSTGDITGTRYVGGVCGSSGDNNNCYSTGDITGSNYVGGISGGSSVSNGCYALNNVIYRLPGSSSNDFGDVVGGGISNNNKNCYSLDTLEFRQL